MNLDSLAEELDRLYEFEISEYIERCDQLKKQGFRIFRNSEGKHKVTGGGGGQGRGGQNQYQYRDGNVAVNDKKPKKDNFFIRAKKRIKRGIDNFKTFIGVIKAVTEYAQQNNRRY